MSAAPTGLREPNISAVRNGEPEPTGGQWIWSGMFPVYVSNARLVNAGEISAATGSVPTNDSPGFLDSLGRDIALAVGVTGDTVKQGGQVAVDEAKKVSGGVGSIITALFPTWFWLLLGLGLVAYVLTILLPYVKKPA